ncbi:MAG: hypothetical protein M3Y81_10910 [Chloroflexota bacterium]|nr:hypothetical protein [Chloroflexota bacterium]
MTKNAGVPDTTSATMDRVLAIIPVSLHWIDEVTGYSVIPLIVKAPIAT